jgi:hypothetical protein
VKLVWTDRRTYLGTLALVILAVLGIYKGVEVVMAISSIVLGIASVNAVERYKLNAKGDNDEAPKPPTP